MVYLLKMAMFNSYVKLPEGIPGIPGTLWLCQQLAIENGHLNSGFSHW